MKKRLSRRDSLWPDAAEVVFPSKEGGWAQVPRTIPMISALLDTPAFGGKDDPGRVYSVLWAHSYGDGFVEVSDPALLALEAGYLTARAERSFDERMKQLVQLGFLRAKQVGLRDFGAVLLPDPHAILRRIREKEPSRIPDRWWSAFEARCAAVGIRLAESSAARPVDDDEDEDEDE
ncbi:MAG: hypothetical protein SFX73_10645 [Kofleriaceae bacterium]|nr:hypothetical protein [Kofleriaceae bacterium]